MPATLLIKPWHDPIVDTLGYDPRSRYVETFWLPTLGPTALLLLRHLADRFDHDPDGVELTVVDTSHALGLGQRDGSASPIVRTLRRLTQFDLACEDPMSDTVAVRRNIPPVNTRHLRRLPRDCSSRTPNGPSSSSPNRRWPRRAAAPGASRSRCSSRATTPITSSGCCTRRVPPVVVSRERAVGVRPSPRRARPRPGRPPRRRRLVDGHHQISVRLAPVLPAACRAARLSSPRRAARAA